MTRRFRQLQAKERVTLALRQQGMGLRDIAEVLGRNVGSLSRELCRNADSDGTNLSQQVQFDLQARRRVARGTVKLDPAGPL